ncbi:hypothetical protein ACF068_24335 [Streptomyces sp. NPDC016309]|uniref:hypothetical protein n=1 Tax=Streptomyces sp. NPDC016309 TaxID=3364965 RepID=UPI0036F5036A
MADGDGPPARTVPPAGRSRAGALAATAALLSGVALGAQAHAAGQEVYVASCRTSVEGSRVTAYCHNPYPGTDRVQLHVECARWWDIDSDSRPVDVGPTVYAELTQRCWKEVGDAWISHRPVNDRATPGSATGR